MLSAVVLLGTFCLPPQYEHLHVAPNTQLINRTCARFAGIQEQIQTLWQINPNLPIKKIVYIEGLYSTPFFDRFSVTDTDYPIISPLFFLKVVWQSYLDYLRNPAVEEKRYQQAILQGLAPLQAFCRQKHCDVQLLIPDITHSSHYLFALPTPAHIWLQTFYTLFVPRLEIDLRSMPSDTKAAALHIKTYPYEISHYGVQFENPEVESQWIQLLAPGPETGS